MLDSDEDGAFGMSSKSDKIVAVIWGVFFAYMLPLAVHFHLVLYIRMGFHHEVLDLTPCY